MNQNVKQSHQKIPPLFGGGLNQRPKCAVSRRLYQLYLDLFWRLMNYAPPKRKHFAPPTKLMNPKSYFRIHSQGNNQRNIDYLDQCTLHSDIEMPKKNLFWIYTFNSLAPSQTNDLLPTNKQVSSISHFCHWHSSLGLTQRSFNLKI